MCKRALFTIVVLLVISVILLQHPVKLKPGNGQREERILILFNSLFEESITAKRVFKWIYGTMWRIPVDTYDVFLYKINSTWLNENLQRYSMVIFLDMMNGQSTLGDDTWQVIFDKDDRITYIAYGYAVNDVRASKLFGCSSAKRSYVEDIVLIRHWLTEGLSSQITVKRSEVVATPSGGQAIITPWGAPNEALLVVKGNNAWIGLTELGEGLFNRYSYLLSIVERLLALDGKVHVHIQLPERLLAIRIDDIPFSTESWFWRWQYFTPQQYEKFFQILEKHGAHVNYGIIPFNVSKEDGKWISYIEIFPETVQVIREAEQRGTVEVADHGATHVTPYQQRYVEAKTTNPLDLTRIIRFEFGYDPVLKKPIPYELQKEHIEKGVGEVEKWFGKKIELFIPPWHVWNEATEKALAEEGIKVFSGDFRFRKGGYGQPPSVMGEKSKYGLLYVPTTHNWDLARDGSTDTIKYYIGSFLDHGIPVVLLSHGRNWTFMKYREVFSLSNVDSTLTKLDETVKPDYATILQIASKLEQWRNTHTSIGMGADVLTLQIAAPAEMKVKLSIIAPPGYKIEKIVLNDEELDASIRILSLREGENKVVIRFTGEAALQQPMYPLTILLVAAVVVSVTVAASIIFALKRKKKAPNTGRK